MGEKSSIAPMFNDLLLTLIAFLENDEYVTITLRWISSSFIALVLLKRLFIPLIFPTKTTDHLREELVRRKLALRDLTVQVQLLKHLNHSK